MNIVIYLITQIIRSVKSLATNLHIHAIFSRSSSVFATYCLYPTMFRLFFHVVFHPISLSNSLCIHLLSRPLHKFQHSNKYFRDSRLYKLRWRNNKFLLVYDISTGKPATRSTWQQASITNVKTYHKLRDHILPHERDSFSCSMNQNRSFNFCHSVRFHIIYVHLRKHHTPCAWLCAVCKVWCNHKSTIYVASHTT